MDRPYRPTRHGTWKRKSAPNLNPIQGTKFHKRTNIILCTPLVVSNPEVIDFTEEISNPVIDLTEPGPTIKERSEDHVPNLSRQQKLRCYCAKIKRTPGNFIASDYCDCTDVTVKTLLSKHVHIHIHTVLSQVRDLK
jgi:hypothetical protein